MGRSQESFHKKEVRNRKEKKRKDKEKRKLERKEQGKSSGLEEMIAYVDENGRISSTPPDITNKKKVNLEDILISVPRRASEANRNTVRKGIVTFYNELKGFGFIRDLEDQQSVFVHVNDFVDDVREQSRVTFEVEMGHKGPKAINVKLDK